MHITGLSIAGFKSFVDPTDVPIEPGLTGIVGPNGCGKSNLLESLRWVMGANSARAMRGGEMDDLIFSGSGSRPARETAEVQLLLNNEARTAPPEYNDADVIEILRRLKRGAGSTYKINGRTVRAKDVQLLFADASTGANSPSLVRQGQISELIAAKPQNRRRILEEAAGISGLNSRRHEAELKLRAAETNLERLSEVSAEVERQLESLKRQARKARKYKSLSDEIAALEAYAAHLKWLHAREARETAKTRFDEAKKAVEDLAMQDAQKETERLKANEKLGPLREAESLAAAKLGQARIQLARLEAERKAAADALARLEAEAGRLDQDVAREQEIKAEAQEAADRAERELAALPTLDQSLSEAQEAEARNRLDGARETLRLAQEKSDEIAAKLADVRAAKRAATANAESQRRRKAQLENEVEQQKTALAAIAAADELSSVLAAAQSAASDAEMRLHDAERAVESAERDLSEKREAEDAASEPKAKAAGIVSALEAEIKGLERLLRKADSSDAPPVLERIRTRDGYEKAIAVALGDDVQAPTDRSAPMHWAGAEARAESLPDGCEPLTDFVEAPGELAARLSQCGVVEPELGEALSQLLKPGQRLVSKEGHLWRWDGFHRTPRAPVSAAERLEQQARLQAARSEIDPARQALVQAESALDDAKAARRQSEETLRELRANVQPASRALTDARGKSQAAEQAAERASMKRDAAAESLSRAEADLRVAAEALSAIDTPSSDDSETAIEAELTRAKQALTDAREAETEARGSLNDLTRNREQAIKRRDGLTRDLEDWKRRVLASDERMNALMGRKSETHASLTSAAQPDANNDELERLRSEVETNEKARKDAADAFAEAETAYREAEQAARAANAEAGKSREALADAKVRIETADLKFSEIVEIAQTHFQSTPEGLYALAEAGFEEEILSALDLKSAENEIDEKKRARSNLGGVNMEAEAEAEELGSRLGAQANEKEDLIAAIAKLREGVDALNSEGQVRLMEAFEKVNENFKSLFTTLFRGGQAELRLVEDDGDPLASGLEIYAQPPGKRLGTLNLMSGGEQALTATALIFAVFLANPAPICVLDEVDAPLDDANVDRFCNMLNEMRGRTETRFVIITHNPVTMSRMDRLFGVTMREKGVSKLVSVDLNAAEELVAAE